jgi:hypothetical protein
MTHVTLRHYDSSLALRTRIVPHLSVFKDPHYTTSTHRPLPSEKHIAAHRSAPSTHQQEDTGEIIPSAHRKTNNVQLDL